MSAFSARAIYWTPRCLALAFLAFLSLFSLDVFNEHLGFAKTLLALAMHLMPVFFLALILLLAWRWEWIGAALFAAAGIMYIRFVLVRRVPLPAGVRINWITVIAGPAFLIAALFLAAWLRRSEIRRARA